MVVVKKTDWMKSQLRVMLVSAWTPAEEACREDLITALSREIRSASRGEEHHLRI